MEMSITFNFFSSIDMLYFLEAAYNFYSKLKKVHLNLYFLRRKDKLQFKV